MLETVEAGEICRDENCSILELHAVGDRRHEVKVHHRPKANAPLAPSGQPWKRADTSGLLSSVMKTTNSRVPRWFQEIRNGVVNDYGDVTDRTVMRAVKKLVDRGALIKLNIGLAFAVYMRPIGKRGKKPLGRIEDPAEMREYMMGLVEMHPVGRDAR